MKRFGRAWAVGGMLLWLCLSSGTVNTVSHSLTLPGTNLYQANDDYATTVANVPVTIDVLANDNCILNGLPCLTGSMVQSVTQPSKGVATINPDNTVTYSPNLRFVGTDSFTYTASDSTGLLTGTATVHLTVNQRGTSTTVTPGSSSVTTGGTLIFTATVSDTSSGTKTAPTGTVAWSDGGAGGSFSNGGTCTLSTGSSQSQCNVTYTASSTAGSVIITGRYSGDSAHTASSGASALTVNAGPPPSPHPTTTGVSPNPASVTTGSQIAFTAVVTDTSASPTAPSGSVSWSDGGKGGSFSSSTCLSGGTGQSQCSTTYTAPSAGGSVTITSSYSGDSSHTASSGMSS